MKLCILVNLTVPFCSYLFPIFITLFSTITSLRSPVIVFVLCFGFILKNIFLHGKV